MAFRRAFAPFLKNLPTDLPNFTKLWPIFFKPAPIALTAPPTHFAAALKALPTFIAALPRALPRFLKAVPRNLIAFPTSLPTALYKNLASCLSPFHKARPRVLIHFQTPPKARRAAMKNLGKLLSPCIKPPPLSLNSTGIPRKTKPRPIDGNFAFNGLDASNSRPSKEKYWMRKKPRSAFPAMRNAILRGFQFRTLVTALDTARITASIFL
mmetsp:Transcript_18944/g.37306  ORF Transcript_18944/g.37306 Transcript_18944/m.37306 type:complete len:211 (+) Transcript_18944:126-758(+)